jgi:protein-L-isoaspartate(D-aspartate) O-methyltransferase
MDFARARRRMVDEQLIRRGLRDPRVLAAMGDVPRHAFVPADWQEQAYTDSPLPLGPGATISQPYIVALMLEKAELAAGDRVLEVGTGSGYQAALLAELGAETYSIELDPALAARAARALAAAGYPEVQLRVGDGRTGWPEAAPFAAILVTAAAESVPPALVDQLAEGGRLLIPVWPVGPVGPAGEGPQELLRLRKVDGRARREALIPVRFVPLR